MNVFTLTGYKFFNDFQKFIFSNNILIAAAGWSIGVATKEVIEKILNITIITLLKNLDFLIPHHFISGMSFIYMFLDIIWYLLTWIITIVFTFLLLEYFLNRTVFGLKSTIKSEQEKDFVKSKAEAKLDTIIPTKTEDILPIAKEKHQDNRIVQKTLQEGKQNISKIINEELKEPFEVFFKSLL